MNMGTRINDSFSWRRVGELYTYCSPFIRREMLYYGIAIIFLTIISVLPLGDAGQFLTFTLVWTVIPYMAQLAPLVFAKGGDSRIIDRLVPASPAEKFTFYLSYILVVIPAICYILPSIAVWLYPRIPAIQTETVLPLIKMRLGLQSSVVITNILSYAASTLTCFTAVMYCKSNRIIKGVAAMFSVNIVIALIGGIYGAVLAFKAGYKTAVSGSMPATDPQMIVNDIMAQMDWTSPYMLFSLIFLAAYIALITWQAYRAVNTRNL